MQKFHNNYWRNSSKILTNMDLKLQFTQVTIFILSFLRKDLYVREIRVLQDELRASATLLPKLQRMLRSRWVHTRPQMDCANCMERIVESRINFQAVINLKGVKISKKNSKGVRMCFNQQTHLMMSQPETGSGRLKDTSFLDIMLSFHLYNLALLRPCTSLGQHVRIACLLHRQRCCTAFFFFCSNLKALSCESVPILNCCWRGNFVDVDLSFGRLPHRATERGRSSARTRHFLNSV